MQRRNIHIYLPKKRLVIFDRILLHHRVLSINGTTWLELKKIPASNLSKRRVGGNFRLFLYLKIYDFPET